MARMFNLDASLIQCSDVVKTMPRTRGAKKEERKEKRERKKKQERNKGKKNNYFHVGLNISKKGVRHPSFNYHKEENKKIYHEQLT